VQFKKTEEKLKRKEISRKKQSQKGEESKNVITLKTPLMEASMDTKIWKSIVG